MLRFLLQLAGASVAFIACLVLTDLVLPLPPNILAATPPAGFLSMPAAAPFNALLNGALLVWLSRRSSFRGSKRWMQLATLSFGAQAFQTQIETAYFQEAFPLLQGNLVVYLLIVRGLAVSLLLSGGVTLLTGGFSSKGQPASRWTVSIDRAVRQGAWLAAVYAALYFIFGYFVAWQFEGVRVFYGGPAVLNSFGEQLLAAVTAKPEIPLFQYFRGYLWLLCLVPVFLGFTGRRGELVAYASLTLALLPTAQLAFANPLMPADVSWAHFLEVSTSTGIFGGLCAWFVPVADGKQQVARAA